MKEKGVVDRYVQSFARSPVHLYGSRVASFL